MEKLRITIVALLIAVASYGQTAKEVLDKAAAAVSNKSGITASFTLKGGQMNDKGTISIKERSFRLRLLVLSFGLTGRPNGLMSRKTTR